jgi:outer membrane receptor for ferrienterochelin and colicin
MFKRFFILLALASSPMFAQELTSSLSVGVADSNGGAVAGASVEVTYEPTNSTLTRSTNSDGKVNLVGLRPGGPYTVRVSSALGSDSKSSISLVVGDTTKINLVIQDAGLEEVVTVAQRVDAFGQDIGLSTVISSDDVEKYSSVTRDIKDFVRLNPFAIANDLDDEQDSALNIAGSGGRTNDIKVDGSSYNDDFGLNSNGYPGQNNPITLESIDQINVRVAPVSVEYSNFEGGVIEVVSKGGTNEFKGSVFSYDRGDSFVGNKTKGQKYSPTFDDTSEGFSLGGPIIKDKLFFFVAYEENDKTTPIDAGPAGSGAPFEQNITLDQVEQVRADTISVYGFDPLLYTSSNTSSQENTTVRLDYYLNDFHRLQLNFRESESAALRGGNSSRFNYVFPSNEYLKPESTESEGLLFVSNWTDSFSTELLYSSKTTATGQSSPIGQNTAAFRIRDPFPGVSNIFSGVDIYRSANSLSTEAEHTKFKGIYLTGNHTITFGIEEKSWDVYNLFIVAQDGSYDFASYQDFLDKKPSSFFANNSRSGNEAGGAAAFDYSITSYFIQDEIAVSDKLDITFGLRKETFDGSAPPKNPGFLADYGFANSGFDADIKDSNTYRLGANYTFDNGDSLRMVLGSYSTRFPLVWVSNAYSNNGVQTAAFSPSATCDPTKFPSQVGQMLDPCVNSIIANADFRDSVIVSVAPNFSWPENEVFNLTYETTINDWFVQASYLWKEYDQPIYKALNTGTPFQNGYPTTPSLRAPDGRPIYGMTSYNTYKSALYTQGGSHSESIALSATKSFNDGDGVFTIGYSTQDVAEINTSPSTTPNSSYGRNPNIDPQNPLPGRGAYEVQHRLFANLKSTHYFFGSDKPTTFGLFFERRSGYGISPVFETETKWRGDYETQAFGLDDALQDDDGNFLSYIPTGVSDPLVCWGSCSNPDLEFAAEAMALLRDLGLTNYGGSIAPKGSIETPWVTSLDLKITQVLPGFRDKDNFVITLGIQNLLNLIDDEWGEYKVAGYARTRALFDLEMTDKVSNQYSKYILSRGSEFDDEQVYKSFQMSTWRAQLGFKYNFSF